MELNETELRFLHKRRQLLKYWPFAGGFTLLLLGMLIAWMFWSSPLLVNPYLVWNELQRGGLDDSQLQIMAGLLPVIMLLVLLLTLTVILFAYTVLRNEKREIAIIDRLTQR